VVEGSLQVIGLTSFSVLRTARIALATLIAISSMSGLWAVPVPTANADEYSGTPDTYLALVPKLKPGDQLSLAPGIYREGLPLRAVRGEEGRAIVIEGPASGAPAVFLARERHNTISLRESSHVVIRNLVLDGADLGVDAVKAEWKSGLVHHVTLEGLVIVRHGIDQGVNGISTKTPTAFWTIRNNVIIGAGTGMYLGDSDGSAPFVAGIIEGNLIVDTVGYNLQIKHQRGRPTLNDLPLSPQRTVIRGNFFSKAAKASTGTFARPNLLLGHFPLNGPGSSDEYLVAENVFYANPVESLMQAEGNVVIFRNIFVNPVGNAVSVQPHNDVPRHIEIARNFIVAKGYGIQIQGAHPGYAQVVFGNRDLSGGTTVGESSINGRATSGDNLEKAFQEWLTMDLAARSNNSSADQPIAAALRIACGRRVTAGSTVPAGLIPPAHFLCQQL